MAQAVCEKPQAMVNTVVEQESDSFYAAGAAAKPHANGDLPAKSEAAKANGQLAAESQVKADATATGEKKNRIQVSNTKKPLFFYLNLAKRYLKQYNDVELSALGMAIPTVVTISEILKANGAAVEKKVLTSTVGSKDENKGRLVQKAKIEILLEKNNPAKGSEENQSDEEEAKEKGRAVTPNME